jgi:hypothetical protein
MMANETLVEDAAVVRDPVTMFAPDHTKDLLRIVRNALKPGPAVGRLDRLIRSAAGSSDGAATADPGRLARRMNAVLARRAAPSSAVAHRETIRA